MNEAVLVAIQNTARGKRPGAAKAGRPRLEEEGEQTPRDIIPGFMEYKYPLELWLSWYAPSGHSWRFTLNPFAIWPNNPNLPDDEQPYQCTVSRDDGRVYQREMAEADNLSDILHLFVRLNSSTAIRDKEKFRIGINGWYYLDADDSPKAGATQSQAHAHIVRFPFPIEKAEVISRHMLGAVELSAVADPSFGTATVLEAEESEINSLLELSRSVIESSIFYGNSFNVLVTPGKPGYIKVFVFDRSLGIAQPYFTNEWGFAEMGRAIVIDDLTYFYELSSLQRSELESGDEPVGVWLKRHKQEGDLTVKPALFTDIKQSLVKCTISEEENRQKIDAAVYHAKPRTQNTLANIPVEWGKIPFPNGYYGPGQWGAKWKYISKITTHIAEQVFTPEQLKQIISLLQPGELVRKIYIESREGRVFDPHSASVWSDCRGEVSIRLLLADDTSLLVCKESRSCPDDIGLFETTI